MQRSSRLAAIVVACAATLTGSVASAQAATLDLVLVGDSYTSGNGSGVYTDTKCFRSPINWGQRYATAVRAEGITVNVTNAACGGAVVKDLDGQIAAITPDTDLVALTIGGNDVGFSNIVIQCFAPAIADPTRCKQAVGKARGLMPGVEKAALQRLEAVRARLRPGGKIIVLSYPYLSQPTSYVLRGLFDSYAAGKAVRQLGDLGDQTDINAADAANAEAGYDLVTFVPTKDLFAGHEPNPDPYRENSASWVNEFASGKSPADIYHPKPQGYIAMSQAILRVAGVAGDFGVSQ